MASLSVASRRISAMREKASWLSGNVFISLSGSESRRENVVAINAACGGYNDLYFSIASFSK